MGTMKSSKEINYIFVLLVTGFVVSFVGFFILFVNGFHAFDLAQNMIFMRDTYRIDSLENGCDWNPVFYEMNGLGEHHSFEETYMQGVEDLLNGVLISSLGLLIFGFGLGQLKGLKNG